MKERLRKIEQLKEYDKKKEILGHHIEVLQKEFNLQEHAKEELKVYYESIMHALNELKKSQNEVEDGKINEKANERVNEHLKKARYAIMEMEKNLKEEYTILKKHLE